jgi:hypothetical protein
LVTVIAASVACRYRTVRFSFLYTKKGKAIPLQAWTGPEDSRKFRLSDFKTIGT